LIRKPHRKRLLGNGSEIDRIDSRETSCEDVNKFEVAQETIL
jgi:hypothetical protein